MTDKELLDLLEKKGFGCGLISDDNGHWAVSGTGFQNVPPGKKPVKIATSFLVQAKEWKGSVRAALEAFAKDNT